VTGQGHTPIDFAGLADALLQRAHRLVPAWLSGGVQRGHEWVCGDLYGNEGDSCSVNLTTGKWADFGGGEDQKGGDLISLYAAIHRMGQAEAARELMEHLGWSTRAPDAPARPPPAREDRAAVMAQALQGEEGSDAGDDGPAASPGRRAGRWRPIVPVPAFAPRPIFTWRYHDKQADAWRELEAVRTWEYVFEGQRYGYVARFERTSSKGELVKDTLPFTWCQDTTDPRGSCKWQWKTWDAPRPLYVPATLLSGELSLPVVVVEGEKCAQAGHELLGHEFDFVCWPGGARAVAHAAWGWLMGRTVYLWPDADAKRERLTREEKEAGVAAESKPLLPLQRQPGWRAMQDVGSILAADQGCTVYVLPMLKPGERADGWDIADAIAEGWDAAAVRDYIRSAHAFVPPDDAARAKAAAGQSTPSSAGAGSGEGGDGGGTAPLSWRDKLIQSAKGSLQPVRENAVLALDGMALPSGAWLAGVEEAQGLVAFNEFTNDVVKHRATPWGTAAGVWEETDELEMGNWLTRAHWLPSMARGTLEEAVAMVAKRHRFHPVRELFEGLRGRWDGQKRLGTWLRRACLEEDEWDAAEPLQQYLSRVGTWLVMAICARVLRPGCKFDYMAIFEGKQGLGKSTLARLLGWDWFADTGLVLGDKDSYQNLQGILVYEWGELDALTKSEVTKVKQFVASMKDRFRASFDRRAKDYPRQVVFIGTTNESHYLIDGTGNRRFWPVRITRRIDLDWVLQQREQLFAEAMHYLDAGERFHPSAREERELFVPQQQQRMVDNAIQSAVLRYLYDENQKVGMSGENGSMVNETTVGDLLTRLGISIDKQTHLIVRQATAALDHAGWEKARSSRGDRPYVFRRPKGKPGLSPGGSGDSTAGHDAAPSTSEDGDDCPF
jgi:putative DNA primase/helicase